VPDEGESGELPEVLMDQAGQMELPYHVRLWVFEEPLDSQ
jgi:hypothetical protein